MVDKQKLGNASRVLLHILLYLWLIIGVAINVQWAFRNDDTRDYGSFYAAGKAFLEGKNPYLSTYPEIFVVEVNGSMVASPNLNPPVSLYLTSLFAKLDLHQGFSLWRILNVIFYLLGVAGLVLAIKPKPTWKWILISLSISGLWHIVELGQIYVPIFLILVLMILLFQKDRRVLAGVCLGAAVAIKPNFALILLCILLVKEWRVSISAVVTTFALSLIPLLDRGMEIYLQWFQAQSGYTGSWIPGNSSIPGFFSRFGLTIPGLVVAALAALVVFGLIIRNRWSSIRAMDAGLLLSILCSPIAWPGYSIFAIAPLFRLTNHRGISWIMFILALPIVLIYWLAVPGTFLYILFGSWYGIAWVLLLIWTITNSKGSTGFAIEQELRGKS